MPNSTLEAQAHYLISSIQLCLENRFVAPSLMLIYAAIDIMAWLERDETHPDVQRDDFIRWVETYLLPDSQLLCTAIELYAARCSLLHSYSAESRLSREGRASQIFYAWGSAEERDLQKLIDFEGSRDAKAVQVEKLFDALKTGIEQFLSSTRHPEIVQSRAKKFFSNMPAITKDNQEGVMPINITERYKLVFEEHRHASDYRMKIVQGWCWIYAALPAAFAWVYSESKPLSWIVTASGVLVTPLMWLADYRNRSAIHASKDIGAAIEEDTGAGISENQRFFARLRTETRREKMLTHSRAIDVFAALMSVLLLLATIYLALNKGTLPSCP